MAYSKGRTRFIKDRGHERADERDRYERELANIEAKQQSESLGSSIWQGVGSAVGAGIGFFAGGPAGAYKGFQAGKEAGRWGRKLGQSITGTTPERDFAVSTDVGKFDVSQRYDLEDINRQLKEAEKSRKWQEITDTGTSLMSYFNPPEDLAGKDWWTETGEGKGAPDWLRRFHPQNPNLRSGKEYAWGGRRGQ